MIVSQYMALYTHTKCNGSYLCACALMLAGSVWMLCALPAFADNAVVCRIRLTLQYFLIKYNFLTFLLHNCCCRLLLFLRWFRWLRSCECACVRMLWVSECDMYVCVLCFFIFWTVFSFFPHILCEHVIFVLSTIISHFAYMFFGRFLLSSAYHTCSHTDTRTTAPIALCL